MKDALEGELLEREKKVQTAVRQLPLPSKAKADAPPPLARALISNPSTEPLPAASQLAGHTLSFQESTKSPEIL